MPERASTFFSFPNQPIRAADRFRGFTLVDLMISVTVLVGILLAMGKIFSTTSRVTRTGEATTEVLTEIAAIEQQLRRDFERLSYEGVFAIRNVAIPNDFHVLSGGGLINPGLPPTAMIRADQLLYFSTGVQNVATSIPGAGEDHIGQGVASRIYFGPAFQIGDAGKPFDPGSSVSFEPISTVFPWHHPSLGSVSMAETSHSFTVPTADDVFSIDFGTSEPVTVAPVDARKWLLVRQAVALVDDDNFARHMDAKTRYLTDVGNDIGGALAARSIFRWDSEIAGLAGPDIANTMQVLHGRVDAAASLLSDIRRMILAVDPSTGIAQPWDDQRQLISEELLYYPRAERRAPSMHRADQALTNHVLGSGCSSVRIDWMYEEGVGAADVNGDGFLNCATDVIECGVDFDGTLEHPWFGLEDSQRGVQPYGAEDTWTAAETVFPDNIESFSSSGGINIYEAVFGYNQTQALDASGSPGIDLGYTPWPTAIRITLTLHDPRTTLEAGREVQFVISLPRRGEGVRP